MTTDDGDGDIHLDDLPSVENLRPDEEGGPIARRGFTYQDYIAAQCVLAMIEDGTVLKVQCETLDDIVVIRRVDGATNSAEFVQVKRSDLDQLWSAAQLCKRTDGAAGTSVFEKSLVKDRVKEAGLFKIVTARDVASALKPLTYPRGHVDRALETDKMSALKEAIDKRCPGVCSHKGADSTYWLENAIWEVAESKLAVEDKAVLSIVKLSVDHGETLVPEQALRVLKTLLNLVKDAADAQVEPDWDKKIITRDQALQWWRDALTTEREAIEGPSGGKLQEKMPKTVAPPDVVANALQLRRQYVREVRSPKYMDTDELDRLQRRVRSELIKLRVNTAATAIDQPPNELHAACINAVTEVAVEFADTADDAEAFALGCFYDITDRCQFSFGAEPE